MWNWEAENAKAVIVIVHGANEHHGRYRWLIEQWQTNGMNVVMGDLPGQGDVSNKSRGHIEQFDDYINEVEKWIRHASSYNLPIFLIGHSMGGTVVIRTLQEKFSQVRGVILSSPCLGLVHPPSKALDLVTRGLNVFCPRLRVNSGVTVNQATRNEEVRLANTKDPLYIKNVSVRWYRELSNGMKQANKKVDKFPNIPLLVLQGGEDKIVNKESVFTWFNHVNNSEKVYKEYPELYHEVFNEPEREQVFNYALAFVNNLI
ncbi:alpha/beta hydrolase [Litchfieldia salsa]|uniref:Lysophospholipase n=1 Tax=Litchfieldia salsa TaxID=930152 RepID=A0A1H0QD84_9BACI|nr:alpha/beta hydrolase [Litchfieldia salsa]SDP15341.1 lysophospholipase [Litchfieldia salsa]